MANLDSIKKRILLVEDDDDLAALIKEYLEVAEFMVEIQPHGLNAVERILEYQADIVILDLMLPGKDGISICREVRPSYDKPILMLTASSDSVDHILALEVGADDFINKPVEPRILLAHVRALLRRQAPIAVLSEKPVYVETEQSQPSDIVRFGDISIHTATLQVKNALHEIELTTPEYDILLLLAQQQGVILSRDQIFKAMRGIEYDGQNRLIDITICQLRSKLAADKKSHRHIKTIRNKGYVCVESID